MKNAQTLLQQHRQYFTAGKTRPLAFRKAALRSLKRALVQNEAAILAALSQDLGKSGFEGYITELGMVHEEINYMLRHLDGLARSKAAPTPLMHFPSTSSVTPEPYGVVLILSPWNYPVQLTLSPLVGAIAAGNCAVVKPSAYAPATAQLLEGLLAAALPRGLVSAVQGGRQENQALLEQPFDYIFFTGSVAVGHTVMEAAAKHLTPVTLELGGKSPCIVDETANVRLAAKRIVWGKFINAGQTCVAPDYVLCHHSVEGELLRWMAYYIEKSYGPAPLASPDLPRIVNQKHFDRLRGLARCGRRVYGGAFDEERLKIEPTILADVLPSEPIMQEEIFGPLLPVLTYAGLGRALAFVNRRPKPLALYCFSENETVQQRVMQSCQFGGGCVNDVVVHLATPHMPFGGVGQSGMGGYHGRASFETFSHQKSVLAKCTKIDVPLRYPPYPAWGLRAAKLLFR